MSTGIRPSDVVKSAADEIGNCMAIVRSKAISADDPERSQLFTAYDDLLARLQELVRQDLKAIDRDPQVKEAVTDLLILTQRLANMRREMRTTKAVIERIGMVLGWVDEIIDLVMPSPADV